MVDIEIGDDDDYIWPSHSQALLEGFNKIHKEFKFHDVTLKCNGIEIPAHQIVLASCSPYFHKMFAGEVNTNNYMSVEITGVDVIGLQLVMSFIYSGVIRINEENVRLILETAKILEMPNVTRGCCKFLRARMKPSNCLGFWNIGKSFCIPEVAGDVQKLIENKFSDVVESEEFLEVTVDRLSELLVSDNLNALEDTVFDSVDRWVAHDVNTRKDAARQLCSSIRHTNLSQELVQRLSESKDFSKNDAWYMDIVEDALSFQKLPKEEQRRLQLEGKRGMKRAIPSITHAWQIGYRWIADKDGRIPPNAIEAGNAVYVGRATHNGDLIPGKVLPMLGMIYVPYNGHAHSYSGYKVLCDSRNTRSTECHRWECSIGGQVPEGAIVGGSTKDGKLLYVARAIIDGEPVVGKIREGDYKGLFPYGGEERALEDYEVLVSQE